MEEVQKNACCARLRAPLRAAVILDAVTGVDAVFEVLGVSLEVLERLIGAGCERPETYSTHVSVDAKAVDRQCRLFRAIVMLEAPLERSAGRNVLAQSVGERQSVVWIICLEIFRCRCGARRVKRLPVRGWWLVRAAVRNGQT